MTLPESALAWVQRVTASTVVADSQYRDANTASVHRIVLLTGEHLVLKRYDVDDPYDLRHDRGAHEAAVLEMLEGSDVPVPRLLAVDPDGSEAGAPAVLMGHVAGSSDLIAPWEQPLAAMVAAINRVDPGWLDWQYEPYWTGCELRIPRWATDVGLWRSVFDTIADGGPNTTRGFIHRDLHSGNVLWNQGEVVAVIDWMQACHGPVALDLSHCRANLVMDHGFEIADRFLGVYLEVAPEGAWHPFWDLVDAVDFLPFLLGRDAVDAWRWDARPAEMTRARFEDYLRSALVAVDEIG